MDTRVLEREQIELNPVELDEHVRASLDDTHRELAFFRSSLVAVLYGVLSVVNFFALDADSKLDATVFALIVVVAFSLATDGLMGGFGVYIMIVASGIFMTRGRWVVAAVIMLIVSWVAAVGFREVNFSIPREALMLISALFMACFFYYMRLRSTRRLSEHQLMEQKYKEGLEGALAHIDTLSGLLPICASCKNIRDDAGRWAEIEEYVSQRTHVEFTHSLCPECKDQLYPEYSKEEVDRD